jgi:hypothetical protein
MNGRVNTRAEAVGGRGDGQREGAREIVSRHVNGIKASGAARSGGAVGRFVERMRGKIQERQNRSAQRREARPGDEGRIVNVPAPQNRSNSVSGR